MSLFMRKILPALLITIALSSCRIFRPSIMLKTPKDYTFDQISDTMQKEEYRLSPTDVVSFRLLSNEGFKLVEFTNSGSATSGVLGSIETTVESDGTVKIPIIGRIKVAGLTVREAEQLFETRYSEFYVGAFVIIRVPNKRVIVFPGNSGHARVIPITNNNTTVFEALAQAGGISEDGKAYRVKLIRNCQPKPKVFLMDLSTIDGIKEGNTIVQANDIVYVESRDRTGQRLRNELFPYISLVTSVFLIIVTYSRIK